MDVFLTMLGVLILLFSIAFPIYQCIRIREKDGIKKGTLPISGFVATVGLILIFYKNITEVQTPFATLHTQALTDVGDIAKLKNQAEQQTATINMIASESAKAKDISKQVSLQMAESQEKLASLTADSVAAKEILENITKENEFLMISQAAINGDDRESFDKLEKISKDDSNRFSTLAASELIYIKEIHSSPISFTFHIPWKDGVDPSKFSMSKLFYIYSSASGLAKPALLIYIAERDDIPKQFRIDFMISVMNTDRSLMAVEYAGREFRELTGNTSGGPMDFNAFSSWWAEHRNEFNGK